MMMMIIDNLQAHDPIIRALRIDAVDAQVPNSDVVECGRFLGLAAGQLRASLRFHERNDLKIECRSKQAVNDTASK